METTAYVGIGSNVGDKVRNCQEAIHQLQATPGIEVSKISSLYYTEPVGYAHQDWFINCVVEIKTSLPPREVFLRCKEIERGMGRTYLIKWGPRVIDLDLLFYNDLILREADLEIPHPRLHERGFVLIPLAELNPTWIHPIFKKTVLELRQELKDFHEVKPYQGKNMAS
ncbi:MAG TPA: 2-amino-4-hydroxy-6-hydroxymethyldihydropteridine diphosphokinase [Candidatus Limnocylindrales bacterium]|nr:2-amino-4-hydroxy-6-hydroxymethyldihydropteridine diphosphokinase [Candidatus Limnocylindrales bacterium]